MSDIMIDIETLGKGSNSVIVSIAAVGFDIDGGRIKDKYYTLVDPQSCVDIGMTMDVSTVMWWFNQPERTWVDGEKRRISEVMTDLVNFYYHRPGLPRHTRVWANSPSFDLAILRSAYRRLGVVCPWTYKDEMDLRTLKEMCENDPNKPRKPRFKSPGGKHDALHDAILQAKICSHIWRYYTDRR